MNFQGKKPNRYKIGHSQNFIRTSQIADTIISLTNIHSNDYIIEIGPGKGALTEPIAISAGTVIGIEKDFNLYQELTIRFEHKSNIKFINKDFLEYKLPLTEKYKVVGNIPFALTSDILKKLLDSKNPPLNAYLILQKEAALRFLGSDYVSNKESLFSLRYKPFFTGKIIKIFNKNDFSPRPNVDVVMLHIKKLNEPIITDKDIYLDFISFCLTAWKQNLLEILKLLFSPQQLLFIKNKLGNKIFLKATEVQFSDWLYLFETYLTYSNKFNKEKIKGTWARLEKSQAKLVKDNRTRLVYKNRKQ